MPGQKRSRYLRQMARRRPQGGDRPAPQPDERQVAIRAAAASRDKQLLDLRMKYEPKLQELDEEWAEKRREIWADYEMRRSLIVKAHILEPAKA